MYVGGGKELLNEFYSKYNIHAIPAGNTGAQMGGWFRKEIKSVADLKGLKMRIGGFAGQVLSKLGVVPQQIAGGDIYPALEKGTIDAAEWVGPYDDEKLGFNKVAPFYYYPGWWEGGAGAPRLHQHATSGTRCRRPIRPITRSAAQSQRRDDGEVRRAQSGRLKRLVAGGTQLRPFPQDVMDACYKARQRALCRDHAPRTRTSRRSTTSMTAFRNDQYLWFQVAEYTYDNFMIRARARG